MNVAVLGAAGWLGRAVLANLEGRHRIRAFDYGPQAWEKWKDVDGEWQGEIVHGDLVDFTTVDRVLEGMEGVIHTAAYFGAGEEDFQPFLVNLKGLWNILEIAHRRGLGRVVHIGSCQTVHPGGIFFSSEVRRPDAGLYAIAKRLQEEMCRQFHEGHGLSIIVLRPDYIVDSRLGIGGHREKLGQGGAAYRNGWVCRHDLAQACRLALETDKVDFDVLHVVGTAGAEKTCNVGRTRQVLGLEFRGNLEQYR
jgi:nucleoside-diphosphate-sugar epimerase